MKKLLIGLLYGAVFVTLFAVAAPLVTYIMMVSSEWLTGPWTRDGKINLVIFLYLLEFVSLGIWLVSEYT